MKYEHVANLVFNQPWAILESKHAEIMSFINFKIDGGEYSAEEIQALIEAAGPTRQATRNGAVAVLPLSGVMSQKIGMMEAMSGGTGTEAFGKMFKEAVADPAIGGIVLNIDSPGGSVFGVQELAQTVFDARGTKPIVAMVNSMAASAAYWVASQADEIVITPGGQAGSIGVFTSHTDASGLFEATGQNVTLISAGKKKVDGHPFGPLSDEAKADLQASVNAYYSSFVGAVARGRDATPGQVRSGFGEGAMLGAEESVKAGLANRIGTLDMAIARAGGRRGFQAAADLVTIQSNAECIPCKEKAQMKKGFSAGENLGRVLNEIIDERETDDRSRSDIIQDMGDAAGISPSTVNQILNGSIECPPRDRLEAFARVLRVPVSRLITAAEADGCEYGEEEPESSSNDTELRARRLRLQQLR